MSNEYRQSRVSRPISPGEIIELYLPHSEVCMHMKVAGTVMKARLSHSGHPMVQLYRNGGGPFSGPITIGEAGIYQDAEGFYYYPPEEV